MAKKRRTKKKQQNKGWIIILIILVIALLVYIPLQPKTPGPEKNVTVEPTGIQKGDLVEINFVLSLEDGTVVDTNNVTLAEQQNLENYIKGPFRFIVGKSGKVKGFDDALIGLDVGETTQKIIEPTEKVLVLNNSRREKIVRQQAILTVQKFPLSRYESMFGKPPIKGDVVFNPELVFKYQVVNITEKNVYAATLVQPGEEYTLPGNQWSSQVLEAGEIRFTVVHNPQPNQTIETQFGTATVELLDRSFYLVHEPELGKVLSRTIETGLGFSPLIEFKIVDITDTNFILRRHNYLPQERLTLDVTVLSAQELTDF